MKRIIASIIFVCSVAALHAQTFFPLPAVNGTVRGFAAHGDIVYIVGDFTMVGAAARNGIAAIDLTTGLATSWDPNPTNGGNAASVFGITTDPEGTTIYFCGNFDKVGSVSRQYLAAVSASGVLQSLSATFNDQVKAVREVNGQVYIIGNFTMVNATARVGFAGFDVNGALNGFNPGLAAFNTGASFRGAAISFDGTKIYLSLGNSSLDFTDTDGSAVSRRGFASLRLSDGRETKFRPSIIDSGNAGGTFAVAVSADTLYIGGPFDTVEGVGVNRLASFDNEIFDATFSPETGTGPDGAVRSVARAGGTVYVAGDFNNVSTVARKGLAALDAVNGAPINDWDAQSSVKLSGADTVLFVHEGIVFVGGSSLDAGAMLLGQNVQYYAALTAAPDAFVTGDIAPPPQVYVNGKKKITTKKSKITIKGGASGDTVGVTYVVGKKKGKASGTTSWSFTAKLKLGKNTIVVQSHSEHGDSVPEKITVTRK